MFLKGERCMTDKCSFERKNYGPGQHGQRRAKVSEFGLQLREKQRARRIYGVLEQQFRRYYRQAIRSRGLTGLVIMQALERRLDNVVYRLGYAQSRAQARMLVNHGHFLVNGRRTNVPSMQLKPGDMISVREGSHKRPYFKELPDLAADRPTPKWLSRDEKSLVGQLLELPTRQEIDSPVNEQLIVEFYDTVQESAVNAIHVRGWCLYFGIVHSHHVINHVEDYITQHVQIALPHGQATQSQDLGINSGKAS